MTDIIAHVFLALGNMAFIGPLLLIGFIRSNRRFFYELTCLMLFSIVINVALKGIFHIPLPKELGITGFAFPSGHMQIATVFYAYMILYGKTHLLKHASDEKSGSENYREKIFLPLNLTLILLLVSIGWSLIHCGYHTIYDVIAAAITAFLLITGYRILLDNLTQWAPWILVTLATFTMIYSCIGYPQLPQHAWLAWYGLIGLIAMERINKLNTGSKLWIV